MPVDRGEASFGGEVAEVVTVAIGSEVPNEFEPADWLASTARDGNRFGNRLEYEEHGAEEEAVPLATAIAAEPLADGWPTEQWDGYPMLGTPTRENGTCQCGRALFGM